MNYEALAGKYLLLDTNVVVNYANFNPFLLEVIDRIESHKITSVLDELVRFEFLRDAASPTELQVLREFLKGLFRLDDSEIDIPFLPPTPELFTYATEIANLYSWKLKNSKISVVDCFLAARMRKANEKTPDRVYLVSSDHTDFPDLLFDRIGIETIDLGNSILNIGFYRFNIDKFTKLHNEYIGLGAGK